MKYTRQKPMLMGLVAVLFMGFMGVLSQWLGIYSFARWETFYESTYNGIPCVRQEREEKGFSTNHIDYRVRLGDLPAAEILATTTDWGPPYSNTIFGAAPYCYTAPVIPARQNEPDSVTQAGNHSYTLLYLSPKTFSRVNYDQYCAFMKSEWPKVDSKYAEKEYTRFPHLIGLVYARQDDITKRYYGSWVPYPGTAPGVSKKVFIRIQNDGRVELVADDRWRNTMFSGLSLRVQMPGNRLFLDTTPHTGGLTMADIRTFKDDRGRSPDMDFWIVEKHP